MGCTLLVISAFLRSCFGRYCACAARRRGYRPQRANGAVADSMPRPARLVRRTSFFGRLYATAHDVSAFVERFVTLFGPGEDRPLFSTTEMASQDVDAGGDVCSGATARAASAGGAFASPPPPPPRPPPSAAASAPPPRRSPRALFDDDDLSHGGGAPARSANARPSRWAGRRAFGTPEWVDNLCSDL